MRPQRAGVKLKLWVLAVNRLPHPGLFSSAPSKAPLTVSIRATCTRCREAIVTTRSMRLGERDVDVLAAHVRACERIPPAERPPGGALLGELLRYFDININLG